MATSRKRGTIRLPPPAGIDEDSYDSELDEDEDEILVTDHSMYITPPALSDGLPSSSGLIYRSGSADANAEIVEPLDIEEIENPLSSLTRLAVATNLLRASANRTLGSRAGIPIGARRNRATLGPGPYRAAGELIRSNNVLPSSPPDTRDRSSGSHAIAGPSSTGNSAGGSSNSGHRILSPGTNGITETQENLKKLNVKANVAHLIWSNNNSPAPDISRMEGDTLYDNSNMDLDSSDEEEIQLEIERALVKLGSSKAANEIRSSYMEHVYARGKGKKVNNPKMGQKMSPNLDVLITEIKKLRDKRLKSWDPSYVTDEEKQKVGEALRQDPTQPLVIVALLGVVIVPGKYLPNSVSMHFLNLFNAYCYSTKILLMLANIFLSYKKDHPYVRKCLKQAYKIDPTNPEVNYLCGMHLCQQSTKADFGPGNKEMFIFVALSGDKSKFEYVREYYHMMLGTVSLIPVQSTNILPNDTTFTLGRRNTDGSFLTSIIKTLTATLQLPSSKKWTQDQRVELEFLRSLAAYLKGEVENSLNLLLPIYTSNTLICLIKKLDETGANYGWDASILSFQKFKEWLQLELDESVRVNGEGDESDEDDDMIDLLNIHENEDYGEDFENKHPIEYMLIYLLRSI